MNKQYSPEIVQKIKSLDAVIRTETCESVRNLLIEEKRKLVGQVITEYVLDNAKWIPIS